MNGSTISVWDCHDNNYPLNNGIQNPLVDLNKLHCKEPLLYQNNFTHEGFEWIDKTDNNFIVLKEVFFYR